MLTTCDTVLFIDKIVDMIALWRGRRKFGKNLQPVRGHEEQHDDKSGTRYESSPYAPVSATPGY